MNYNFLSRGQIWTLGGVNSVKIIMQDLLQKKRQIKEFKQTNQCWNSKSYIEKCDHMYFIKPVLVRA